MFIDWLSIHQEYDFNLPFMGERASIVIDTETGQQLTTTQPVLKYEGSHSTSINIRVSGNRVSITGNPSRINRQDNLYGFTTIDSCVAVYNNILLKLGLPVLTKCTKIIHLSQDSDKVTKSSDGACITELHITSNKSVGQGNELSYIKGVASLRYRHMIPRLHTNGQTADWLTKTGKGSSQIYPSVYNKAFEMRLHALPKIIRKYGINSDQHAYLLKVIEYCESHGVVRFEQKLKNNFLTRNNYRYFGLTSHLSELHTLHNEFLNIDDKLQVTSMDMENIAERLLRLDIVSSTRAANTSALYAIQWMHGASFDTEKSQVKTHRARLRKIGIDIFDTYDQSKHSPIYIKKATQVTVSHLVVPSWYEKPATTKLSLVA